MFVSFGLRVRISQRSVTQSTRVAGLILSGGRMFCSSVAEGMPLMTATAVSLSRNTSLM